MVWAWIGYKHVICNKVQSVFAGSDVQKGIRTQ